MSDLGEANDTGVSVRHMRRPCVIPGCSAYSKARGLCGLHYGEARDAGVLEMYPKLRRDALPRVRKVGERWKNQDGYMTIVRPDGQLMTEHRYVMEQIVGRPLVKGENVHHLNGVRDDNRPENLELWVTVQPYGQRARDVQCPHCEANWWTGEGVSEMGNLAPLSTTPDDGDTP